MWPKFGKTLKINEGIGTGLVYLSWYTNGMAETNSTDMETRPIPVPNTWHSNLDWFEIE